MLPEGPVASVIRLQMKTDIDNRAAGGWVNGGLGSENSFLTVLCSSESSQLMILLPSVLTLMVDSGRVRGRVGELQTCPRAQISDCHQ